MPTFDLAAWRAARTATLTLPSGLVVSVKKVNLIDLAAQGRVPTPLAAQVEALINRVNPTQVGITEFPESAAVIDLVFAAAVVEPPVADVADETHLAVSEVPFLDRLEVFNWAQAEAAQLAPFSGQAG